MAGGRLWTPEEEQFLQENVGKFSLSVIAKRLGRTVEAVETRLHRLGIGETKFMSGCLTANELARVIKIDHHSVVNWIKKHGLPAKQKITRVKARYYLIDPKDFWKWAEENKDKVPFARIEPNSLPPEPDWVKAEREREWMENPRRQQEKWTSEEDERLEQLIKMGYSYREIGRILGRSEIAVGKRIHRLRRMNKSKVSRKILIPWTDEEIRMILELEKQGLSDEEIAEELGRERGHVTWKRMHLRRKGLYKGRKHDRIGLAE